MVLTIDDPEAERLASDHAANTGETPAELVARLIREHLAGCASTASNRPLPSEVFAAARARLSQIPDLDPRSADEILGYDERGLPA